MPIVKHYKCELCGCLIPTDQRDVHTKMDTRQFRFNCGDYCYLELSPESSKTKSRPCYVRVSHDGEYLCPNCLAKELQYLTRAARRIAREQKRFVLTPDTNGNGKLDDNGKQKMLSRKFK